MSLSNPPQEDTTYGRDSAPTADKILELLKLQQEALLSKVEAELPKTLTRRKLHKMFENERIDWNKYCSELAVSDIINQVKTQINKLRLEL